MTEHSFPESEIVRLINVLRADEGDSVEILCDNPDFNGQPNCAIVCCGDWTGWLHKRFAADTLLDALSMAMVEKNLPSPRKVIATSNGHHWIERFNLVCCRDCGFVRRADDQNKPCQGPVGVGLRRDLLTTTASDAVAGDDGAATPSKTHGTKEALHYLGAIKVRLELLYEHSTQDARLLEHLSDEVDWIDVEIERLRGTEQHSLPGHEETMAGLGSLTIRSRPPAQPERNPADEMIGQIEARFPNWKSYRDLVDCIDCTLHALRGISVSSTPSAEPISRPERETGQ